MPHSSSRSLVVVRLASALAAGLVLVQLVLALASMLGGASLYGLHGILGYVALAATLVATAAAVVWSRRGGSKGLVMHGGGMAVLMVVQLVLGLAGVFWVHVALGVLVLLGVVALATLAYRKPGGAA